MRRGEKRTETLSFTAELQLRKQIEEMADEGQRTISQQIRLLVLKGMAVRTPARSGKRRPVANKDRSQTSG